jgi:hypothetical protein
VLAINTIYIASQSHIFWLGYPVLIIFLISRSLFFSVDMDGQFNEMLLLVHFVLYFKFLISVNIFVILSLSCYFAIVLIIDHVYTVSIESVLFPSGPPVEMQSNVRLFINFSSIWRNCVSNQYHIYSITIAHLLTWVPCVNNFQVLKVIRSYY